MASKHFHGCHEAIFSYRGSLRLSFWITKGSVDLIKTVEVCGNLSAQNSFYTSLIKVVVLSVFWGRKWSREYYLVFFNNHIWHTFSWRFIIKRSKGDGNRILVRNILAQQIHFVLWVFKLLYGILSWSHKFAILTAVVDRTIPDQNLSKVWSRSWDSWREIRRFGETFI